MDNVWSFERPRPGGVMETVYLLQADKTRWDHATDYKGRVVPLEVLNRMRIVERKDKSDWDKRNVEVSDEGWAVLQEWYDAELRKAWKASLWHNMFKRDFGDVPRGWGCP